VKISVALCTYNGARFLPEQLESLLSQTRPPEEVVVCDDCSRDRTAELLESFAAKAPFPVRLHYNPRNLGSTRNFQQVIALCQGEVIALCDQDDIWHPQKLERTHTLLNNKPEVGLVFTDAEVVDENAAPLGYTLWQILRIDPYLQDRISAGKAFEILWQRPIVTGATMAFRTRFRDLVLPIHEDLSIIHDGWIALVISTVARLGMIDETLVKYRQHQRQQIGPPKRSIGKNNGVQNIQSWWKAGCKKHSFKTEIKKLSAIRDRLAANGDNHFEQRPPLDQILKHLEIRASMRRRKPVNIPYIARELLTLRYHRYSNGLYSALKDLLW
jgi:glycosyltransferase involved in cell wall biosynthesis